MKRIGNLKQYWCNYEALLTAWHEVRKDKTYHHQILAFENNLAVNLTRILTEIENNSYQGKPTRDFYITDPKKRLIQAPHLEDRIVQHALLKVIRDLIENRFIDQTYACRTGKGTHKASGLLKSYLITYKNNGYYLKIDVKKFFYSINHKILEHQLKKIIKCKPTLELLKKFYHNDSGIGLPLGNVTSQVLANLALSPVDHFIKRILKIKHYIRYMDDFILLCKSKLKLKLILKNIKRLLAHLHLTANEKTQIGLIKNGIDFVGYRTWFTHKIIRKRSLYKIKRILKKFPDQNRISSYMSHSKQTASLLYVVRQILESAPDFEYFVKHWLIKNKYEVHNALLQM